ncbi:ESCO1/2 acetyl-transferase-domain-containing protein [Gaertneriomyces semiglobifer]|nr:ESCO1/2 acetyl-transferase-domain-containing protein [Gaertneriomyces semiglobifer]
MSSLFPPSSKQRELFQRDHLPDISSLKRPPVKVTYADRRAKRDPALLERACTSENSTEVSAVDSRTIHEAQEHASKRRRTNSFVSITDYFRPLQPSPNLASKPIPAKDVSNTHTSTKHRKSSSPCKTHGGSSGKLHFEQLFLDLGQRDVGITTCPECGMKYSKAKPEDEALHVRYHRASIDGIEWSGYKTEIIASKLADGSRIVVVTENCSGHIQAKANEAVAVINGELGSVAECITPGSKIFLYISDHKRVVGCVVAEPIEKAFRVVSKTLAIDDSGKLRDNVQQNGSVYVECNSVVQSPCGISRIWVSKRNRRKGIASAMLDAIRVRFVFGCAIGKDELAFSQPTKAGKALAERYTDRVDFLVYSPDIAF